MPNYLVYLDDVIVFSSKNDNHFQHMDDAQTLLRNARLTLRLKKCTFFEKEFEYLGHRTTPGRLGFLDAKTCALRDAPYPSTQSQNKIFLGTCYVYRRVVQNFARIGKALRMLTSNTLPLRLWTPRRRRRSRHSIRQSNPSSHHRCWPYPTGTASSPSTRTPATRRWVAHCFRQK